MYGLFIKGIQFIDDMTPHNDEDFDPNGLSMKKVITNNLGNPMLHAGEDVSEYDIDTFGAISSRPRLSCILKLKLNQMNVQSTSPIRNLNVEFEDFPITNIIENLTKYHDKASQGKDRVKENVSNNIDNVVKYFVSADKGSISMNNKVHDGSEPVNEDVTKDVDFIMCLSFMRRLCRSRSI